MKKAMILLCAVMLCACGGGHKEKTFSREENVEYVRSMLGVHTDGLEGYSAEELEAIPDWEYPVLLSPYGLVCGIEEIGIEDCLGEQIDTIANRLRRLNMRLTPYTSVDSIVYELSALWELRDNDNMMDSLYDYFYWVVCTTIALNRTEFHLQNPITWREYSPTKSYCPLKVTSTPDGKHKFYDSPSLNYVPPLFVRVAFHQYESDDSVVCEVWGGRDWQFYSGVREAWQFDYHDSTFYVLQRVCEPNASCSIYTMDFVTFERDGAMRRHEDRFLPDGHLGAIAWTTNNLPVCYTFDPETLTVTAMTQKGMREAGEEERLVIEKWQLKLD